MLLSRAPSLSFLLTKLESWSRDLSRLLTALACEQALCLGKKVARKGKGKFPARSKACPQAITALARGMRDEGGAQRLVGRQFVAVVEVDQGGSALMVALH